MMNYRTLVVLMVITIFVLPVHAEQHSSFGELFIIGSLQAIFFMFVFWLWDIFKHRKNDK